MKVKKRKFVQLIDTFSVVSLIALTIILQRDLQIPDM